MILVWNIAELEGTQTTQDQDGNTARFRLWSGVSCYPHQPGFDYDAQDIYMRRMAPAILELDQELQTRFGVPSVYSDGEIDLDKIVDIAGTIGTQYFVGDTSWLEHIVRCGELDEETLDEGPDLPSWLIADAWIKKHGVLVESAWAPRYGHEQLEIIFRFDPARPLHEIDQLQAQTRQTLNALWAKLVQKYEL